MITQERAMIVGVKLKQDTSFSFEESLAELKDLSSTAGIEVIATLTQQLKKINPRTFIGSGKLQELKELKEKNKSNLVIFDNNLSATQIKNLEDYLGCKVIDRTELILDIFAQAAHTQEAKLQVELACLKYRLARLTGKGILLSRLGGGIGTRGPGETKLEYDKRRIKERIDWLRKKIESVRMNRSLQRKMRSLYPHICLVGYTNAGKSTLMNTLTHALCKTQEKLFTTLDPTRRLFILPNHAKLIMIDTVGFIQNLPVELVSAFSATLEEIVSADLLLHVVDVTSNIIEEKIRVVMDTLNSLGAHQQLIFIFNKIDAISELKRFNLLKRLEKSYPNSVAISALHKTGLDSLIKVLENIYPTRRVKIKLKKDVEYNQLYNILSKYGDIRNKYYLDDEIVLEVYITEYLYKKMIERGVFWGMKDERVKKEGVKFEMEEILLQ